MPTVETILNSDTKTQILRTLALNDKSYSSADLEEATTKDITSIYKALENLRDEKVLKTIQTEGKTKYYKIDNTNRTITEIITTPSFPGEIGRLFLSEVEQYGLGELPPHPLNIVFDFRKKLINQIEGLKTIILFGSAARGEYTLGSDLDFYIVCKDNKKDTESLIFEFANQYDHEFSLKVRTVEQYEEDFSRPLSKLANSITKDGFSLLYGDAQEITEYISEASSGGVYTLGSVEE